MIIDIDIDIDNVASAIVGHLEHNSVTVKIGDNVANGADRQTLQQRQLKRAHLHSQLFRGSAPLTGDKVPFQFDRLTFAGDITGTTRADAMPVPRTKQCPLGSSITV